MVGVGNPENGSGLFGSGVVVVFGVEGVGVVGSVVVPPPPEP